MTKTWCSSNKGWRLLTLHGGVWWRKFFFCREFKFEHPSPASTRTHLLKAVTESFIVFHYFMSPRYHQLRFAKSCSLGSRNAQKWPVPFSLQVDVTISNRRFLQTSHHQVLFKPGGQRDRSVPQHRLSLGTLGLNDNSVVLSSSSQHFHRQSTLSPIHRLHVDV